MNINVTRDNLHFTFPDLHRANNIIRDADIAQELGIRRIHSRICHLLSQRALELSSVDKTMRGKQLSRCGISRGSTSSLLFVIFYVPKPISLLDHFELVRKHQKKSFNTGLDSSFQTRYNRSNNA